MRICSSRTRTPCRGRPLTRADVAAARAALGEAYLRTGDYDAVDRMLAGAAGDPAVEADVLSLRGMTLHFRAIDLPPEERAGIDPGPEQELFDEALALRRALDDAEGIAESLFQLGLVHQVLRRDLDAGAPYVREALEVVSAVRDADGLLRSEIHRHAGFDLLLREERPDDALVHFRESLVLRETLAERGWRASARIALSLCERLAGRRAEALEHARQALEIAREEGLRERFVAGAEDAVREAASMPATESEQDAGH